MINSCFMLLVIIATERASCTSVVNIVMIMITKWNLHQHLSCAGIHGRAARCSAKSTVQPGSGCPSGGCARPAVHDCTTAKDHGGRRGWKWWRSLGSRPWTQPQSGAMLRAYAFFQQIIFMSWSLFQPVTDLFQQLLILSTWNTVLMLKSGSQDARTSQYDTLRYWAQHHHILYNSNLFAAFARNQTSGCQACCLGTDAGTLRLLCKIHRTGLHIHLAHHHWCESLLAVTVVVSWFMPLVMLCIRYRTMHAMWVKIASASAQRYAGQRAANLLHLWWQRTGITMQIYISHYRNKQKDKT